MLQICRFRVRKLIKTDVEKYELTDYLHYKELLKKTRMKTSISSKAFCSITDRQTDKIFTE